MPRGGLIIEMTVAAVLPSSSSCSEMNLAVSKMTCLQYYCGNVRVPLRSLKKNSSASCTYVFQKSSEMPGNEMPCFYLLLEKRSSKKG